MPILGEQAGETRLDLSYQGCSDDGFCYPPETKQFKLTIDSNLALSKVDIEDSNGAAVSNSNVQPNNEIERVLVNQHWLMVILSFFGLWFAVGVYPLRVTNGSGSIRNYRRAWQGFNHTQSIFPVLKLCFKHVHHLRHGGSHCGVFK